MTASILLSITALLIPIIVIGMPAKSDGAAGAKYTVNDLGIINHIGSSANAINDAGEVIGTLGMGESDDLSPQANHTFLWRQNKVTDFGRSRVGTWINAKGQIVGMKYLPDFDLDDLSKMFEFSPILYSEGRWKSMLPKGSVSGYPVVLNDSGKAAGLLRLTGSPYNKLSPAVWSDSDIHLLEIPATYISGVVKGLNNNGQAIGFLQKVSATPASYETYAVLWDKAGLTLLGSLPDSGGSEAVAINQNGLILCLATFNWEKFQKYMREMLAGEKDVKAESFSFGGYLWDHGKIIPLVEPHHLVPGINVSKGYVPHAINDNETVVSRATGLDGKPVAFVWQDHNIVNLNSLIASDTGWTLVEAKGINNKGQIVGQGRYYGKLHAFLLTPQQGT